jgi:hypothetical protein
VVLFAAFEPLGGPAEIRVALHTAIGFALRSARSLENIRAAQPLAAAVHYPS